MLKWDDELLPIAGLYSVLRIIPRTFQEYMSEVVAMWVKSIDKRFVVIQFIITGLQFLGCQANVRPLYLPAGGGSSGGLR